MNDYLFANLKEKISHRDKYNIINSLLEEEISIIDYSCSKVVLSNKQLNKLKKIIDRLNEQEPVAYILGYRYFFSKKLYVDKTVLIPRDETEKLVDDVLKKIVEAIPVGKIHIVDLGAGSGAIGITLFNELEILGYDVYVDLIEISKSAINILNKNGRNKKNISIINKDIFNIQLYKYDIIVSNPPYIANSYPLDKSVLFEPTIALLGGEKGSEFILRLLDYIFSQKIQAKLIAIEIGYDQSEYLKENLTKYQNKMKKFYFIKDYNNINRELFIEL